MSVPGLIHIFPRKQTGELSREYIGKREDRIKGRFIGTGPDDTPERGRR